MLSPPRPLAADNTQRSPVRRPSPSSVANEFARQFAPPGRTGSRGASRNVGVTARRSARGSPPLRTNRRFFNAVSRTASVRRPGTPQSYVAAPFDDETVLLGLRLPNGLTRCCLSDRELSSAKDVSVFNKLGEIPVHCGPAGEEIWWSQPGSNRRPLQCHCSALPAELWPHASLGEMTILRAAHVHIKSAHASAHVVAGLANDVVKSSGFRAGEADDGESRGPAVSDRFWHLSRWRWPAPA